MKAPLLMATYGMPTEWLLYPGLVLMIAVAIWDLKAVGAAITPAERSTGTRPNYSQL